MNKLSHYDTHLPDYILRILEKSSVKLLTLDKLEHLLAQVCDVFDVHWVVLGGGEPTLDVALPDIVRLLKKHDLKIRLLTNGVLLSRELAYMLIREGLCEEDCIVISLKAFSDNKYQLITGQSNRRVLENLEQLTSLGLKIAVELVHVPGLVDLDEIIRVAEWIRSVYPDIELVIDPYVPVPDLPYRSPDIRDREVVVNTLRKLGIKFTYRIARLEKSTLEGGYIVCRGTKLGFKPELSGNIHLIYPQLVIRRGIVEVVYDQS